MEKIKLKTAGRVLFSMFFGLVFTIGSVFSQDHTIKGVVVDVESKPIAGATIVVVGSSNAVMSGADGTFSISTSIGKNLEVRIVGFLAQTIRVTEKESLRITLEEDVIALGDVVVVGYGVQKKETLTGSISSLRSTEIIKTKAPSLAQAIQGKVAGLRIRQQDGEPGNFNSSINIRGFGSPLYIIDGVVRDGGGEFQRLNPEDIESISFLKDATAAIYGMNSANGAIIVTTKRGKVGRTRITISTNVGLSSPTDIPQMANAAQYMTMRNEAETNAGNTPYLTAEELAKWQTGGPGYESYDYWDEITRKNALQTQTTLSVEGGSDKIRYFGSIGYMNDNSILKNDALTYDRYTFRANVNMDVAKNLVATINVGGRMDKKSQPWFSFFEPFKSTRVNPPIKPMYANNNPKYYNTFEYVINPASLTDHGHTGSASVRNKNLQTLFALEYAFPFLDGLKFKGTLAYDVNQHANKGVRKGFETYTYDDNTGIYTPARANYPSFVNDHRNEASRLDMQFQATYNKTFNKKHTVGALYVYERREEKSNWVTGERKFDFFSIPELNNGRLPDQLASGFSSHQAYLSHIGRVSYDYLGKYMVEVAARYDGSYRYAPGQRWALFPSASIGWRISEESFIKDNAPFINNLKIRASAGRSGQDAGDAFQYFRGYGINSGGYVFDNDRYTNGVSSPVLINRNLTWVNVDMYNIGFDLTIFNGMFSMEFDLYQRERFGLLANKHGTLPNIFGAKLPQENLNGDLTRGIEFTLGHENTVGDFHYNIGVNFNLARTMNKYVERGPFNSSWDRWRSQSSNRWNDFIWGYQVDGRFQNYDQINSSPIQNGDNGNSKELPGDFILRDLNGDGIINDIDRTPQFWSSTPMIHYGINIELSWKNIDFYALFQGSALYTVQFDEVYAKMLAFKGGNTPEYFYNRWHQADPYNPNSEWIAGEWPAIRLEQDMGSFYTRDSKIWRKDASYLRLKTVEIGYTLNPKWLEKAGMSGLRVYVNGNNLLTFADSFVKAFDPEKIEGAYNAGLNYPLSKSFNFGLTVNF